MIPLALRDLLGQSLLVGFGGSAASDAFELLETLRPAGLVLLPRNIRSAAQVADLTSGVRSLAQDMGLPHLLFATDQEGGSVTRLSAAEGFTPLPSAMALGNGGDPFVVREVGQLIGRELAAIGVDLPLAPVLDLALDTANDVIGSRSFGADPALVAQLGRAFIEGLHASHVLACGKHFPGHGATATDSHLALPRLNAAASDLRDRDLVPFRAAVAAGCDAIMTAHVMSPFDPTWPATLSAPTISGVLRRDIGFDGLVLTDALEMRALAELPVPRPRCGVEALRAGADLLIFEGDRGLIDATVTELARAVDRGELGEAQLARSRRRLDLARARARLTTGAGPAARAQLASPAGLGLVATAASAGVAVSDPAGLLPFATAPVLLDLTPAATAGEAFGWPPVEGRVSSGTAPLVIAVERATDVVAAGPSLREAAAVGRPVAILVLGGWQAPRGTGEAAVVRALDLPRALWPCLKHALQQARP